MYVDPMLYATEELANAIIIKAAHDYREAMKNLWLCPRSACDKLLTAIDGVWLMNKLKDEFETKTKKELEICISPKIKNCRDLSVR